jgi:GTPase SAR1 family protein
LSLDRLEIGARPFQRRFVKIACPGRDCGEKDEDWICSQCNAPIEYGHSDLYIYCDCGRSVYYNYEFKCSSKVHGPGFSQYDSKVLLLLLNNLPKSTGLNILLLGETGVGKSTFINAFVNYLSFHTLDGAMKAEKLNYLIPCSFSTQIMDRSNPDLDIQEVRVAIGATKDEQDGSYGQSATLRTVVHPVSIGSTIIRLIDTPGLGDTRGVEYDRKNVADILSVLSRYDELHGILILLRSNLPRLTLQFHYVVKELLSHFHRDAIKNLAFGFTNTRVSNYTPGDAFLPLSSLLTELNNITLKVSTPTTYCFDSESFRFLAAHKIGIYMGNLQDFMRSWEHSRAEAVRLVGYFRSQPPHMVRSTMTVNNTRDLLSVLAIPIVDIEQLIRSNIARKNDLEQENSNDQLQTARIRALQELIAEYTSEHVQIRQASVLLGFFINEHSTTAYNDATLAYIDSQISDERHNVRSGGSRRVLDALLKDRAEQAEVIQTLTYICDPLNKPTSEPVSEERVSQILVQLYSLKHFGGSLKTLIKRNSVSSRAPDTETPYRVKSGHKGTLGPFQNLNFPSGTEMILNTSVTAGSL